MDTAYPANHQHNPPGDTIQAYDAYGTYGTFAPAPDVNFTSQDLSGTNMYGALPQSHWAQWWSPTEDATLAGSADTTAPNIFVQEESQYNYTYDPETSTQWDSPAAFTHSYSISSQAIDPTGLHISISDTESRHGSSLKSQCKRSTTKPAALKSTIRASTKAIKQEAAPEKSKGRRSQTRPASQPKEQPSPQSDDELDDYRKKSPEEKSGRLQQVPRQAAQGREEASGWRGEQGAD